MFRSYADQNDNIYYSISVYNDGNSGIVEAEFSENRTAPLLYTQTDYKIEILKYIVPTTSIPMFNYKNQGYVALVYDDGINPIETYAQQVLLTNLNVPPGAPQTIQNTNVNNIFSNKYGLSTQSVFCYAQFLKAINYALELAYAALLLVHPAITAPVPYFIYNNNNNLFSLIVHNDYNPLGGSYNNVKIYSNHYIYQFFYSLPIFLTTSPSFIITSLSVNYQVFTTNNNVYLPNYLEMTQQSSSISKWFQVTNIFLISNNVSVNPLNIGTANGKPVSYNVVSNFYYQFTNSLGYNTPLVFIQQGTKDQIDLISGQPLYIIDFKLVYQDIFGDIYPILLSEFESFELVIKFKKNKLVPYLLEHQK